MSDDKNGELTVWRFRREVTLGTVLQAAALLVVLIAGWSNLQKDLALIRHDLAQLIVASETSARSLGQLDEQNREHEYRLRHLERREHVVDEQKGR